MTDGWRWISPLTDHLISILASCKYELIPWMDIWIYKVDQNSHIRTCQSIAGLVCFV